MVDKVIHRGLEGVVIATNPLTSIDGQVGKLMYRGYLIGDLAEHSTYEEVVWLLLHGELPTSDQLEGFKRELATNRMVPDNVVSVLRLMQPDANSMAALRTAVSALAFEDTEAEDNSEAALRRKSVRLTAKMATIVAAFDRIRSGQEPIAPRTDLSHAANFLYMLSGEVPDDYMAHVFDVCLTLHADHEMNASTFAARVTASTLSDIYSAITSAIGTLKGPLHGGANSKVMEMLLQIGATEKAETWIKDALANRQRVMGFGHRVYKVEDPRATVLRRLSKQLGERLGTTKWYEISRVVEQEVLDQKGLYPNVDFYSASTYYMMGIKSDLYTPIFALSRIAGWTANLLEQYADNRLIRPDSEYVGPRERPYVPMAQR
ncbi:MAG: citrate synthase [Candidatus Sericytochromatia bacterium]|uniref:Citrate synthase n=1 Tax=Candidatus Tanganyikabacteria bacterium TaxID=2961651 RepID=A0A937X2G1_9BACT|nr:citrate synthase [Candidatus Tanganyikabacteria bacterium]